LRAAPIDGRFHVANSGVPGRNSRELLLDLPREVEREHPRYAVILVGINDTWTRPQRADIAEAARDVGLPAKWRFEWRTRKLLKLLLNTSSGRGLFQGDEDHVTNVPTPVARRTNEKATEKQPAATKRPHGNDVETAYQLVGSWKSANETIRLARDGRGARGATELRWRIARAGELVFTFDDEKQAESKAEVHLKAQRRGPRLVLTPVDGTTPVVFTSAPESDDASGKPPAAGTDWYPEFQRLTNAGDLAGALAWTERWTVADPDESAANASHIAAANRLQKYDLFAADLKELERIHHDVASRESAENLCYAYELVNRPTCAAALVREELKRFPDANDLHFHWAEACERAGDVEGAIREIDDVIANGDDAPSSFLSWKYRERARWNDLLKRGLASACDVVRSVRADPDPTLLRQLLLRGNVVDGPFDAAFVATDATPEERAFIRARIAEALDSHSPAPPDHLADHLTQVVRWLREQGVEPVLCTYPFRNGSLEKAQRGVAGREKIRLVDLTARFDELLKTHAHDELFVTDGHCSDAGYRVMAEEISAALHDVAR
jgi:lysophospholipase L1-like esterase/tetratricopeptide (TPR) repeat protein